MLGYDFPNYRYSRATTGSRFSRGLRGLNAYRSCKWEPVFPVFLRKRLAKEIVYAHLTIRGSLAV